MVRRMRRVAVRVLVAGGLAALTALVLIALVYPARSAVSFEMDRTAPSFLTGLHAPEREGDRTFTWTSSRIVLRLAGLDRSVDWTCTLHLRGARDASLPMPSLTLSFDGTGGTSTPLSNDFQDVEVVVPARPDRSGLTLTADIGPTFRPGGSDPRELGAQVDWLRCAAAGSVWPPGPVLRAAALGAAAIAVAAAIAGASWLTLALAVMGVATGQAWLLSTGGGAFGDYPSLLGTIATWGAVAIASVGLAPSVLRRPRLSGHAIAAVVVTVLFAVLKLGALEHPGKPLIDALFQAHRLEWVLAGRYFFTQPMPSGVQFPYAIGLYVVAAPLANLITDHVMLLRLVVVAAEAVGGALLYAVVVRTFSDRAAAVLAVFLFHLAPISHIVLGNANLTNGFAQAVGLCAVCGLALMPASLRSSRGFAAGAAVLTLTALAFLSHVGTIVVVAGILGAAAVTLLLARRRDLAMLAIFTLGTILVAGLLAVGLYYRHFTEVYQEAWARVRAPAAVAETVAEPPRPDAPALLSRPLALHERVANTVGQTRLDLGWPLALLALAGLVLRLRPLAGPAALVCIGWGVAWALFLAANTVNRVDVQFQRYALEFIARVNLAVYPLAAALAAAAASWAWRRGVVWRLGAVALVSAATVTGLRSLAGWLP